MPDRELGLMLIEETEKGVTRLQHRLTVRWWLSFRLQIGAVSAASK